MARFYLFVALIVLFLFVVYLLIKIIVSQRSEVKSRLDSMKAELPSQYNYGKNKRIRKPSQFEEKLQKNKIFAGFTAAVKDELYSLGIEDNARLFILIWIIEVVFFPLLMSFLGMSMLLVAIVAVVCALAPLAYLSTKRKNRTKKLEAQLATAVEIICNALKAGYSFQAALHTIGQEMDEPISVEFERSFRETQYGLSLSDSLQNMAKRIKSEDIALLEVAVSVQSNVGGDMVDILHNISNTIRTRHELNEEVKSKTASGRLSGIIVALIPVFILVALQSINPDYCSIFFTTTLGKVMLGVAVFLELIGFLIIKKIVTIKY